MCVSLISSSYLQTVSMHIQLCHRFAPNVNVLDLLRGDVLALRQLEDMLLPVDDLQCAILQEDLKCSSGKYNELFKANAV